ncbi:MAG: hypothetical protein J5939_08680 [Bacteroidales bacterium]|nr:hypothetical protein [Bacteroidales bacterium]
MKRFLLLPALTVIMLFAGACKKEDLQQERYLLSSEISNFIQARELESRHYWIQFKIAIDAAKRLDGYGLGKPDGSIILTLVGGGERVDMPTISTLRNKFFPPCTFATYGALQDRKVSGYGAITVTQEYLPHLLRALEMDEETFFQDLLR